MIRTREWNRARSAGGARSPAHESAAVSVTKYQVRPSDRLRRVPVTTFVLLQYVPFVILPGLRHGTLSGGIATIIGVAVGTTFWVEMATRRLRSRTLMSGRRVRPSAAISVLVIGLLAQFGAVLFGATTYETQVTSRAASPLASIFTPLQVWTVVGLALLVWTASQGTMSERRAIAWAATALSLSLALGLFRAILAPALIAAVVAGFLFWLHRLARLRWIIVAFLGASLLWPTVAEIRNERRVEIGGEASVLGFSHPSERLRLDKSLAQVEELRYQPESPGVFTIARFALVPRVVDRGRGELHSAGTINAALGGTENNSASLTLFGNIWAFSGLAGVAVYSALLAWIVALLVRRPNPWTLTVLGVLVQYGVWIESSYPDSLAGGVQALLAVAFAMVFVRMLDVAFRRRRARPPVRHPLNATLPAALAWERTRKIHE